MKKPSVEYVKINRGTILPKEFVKIGQAAKILSVSIDTLRRWEKSGKITAIRTPGGTRLYSLVVLRKVNPQSVQNFQSESLTTEELLEKTTQSHHFNSPFVIPGLSPVILSDSEGSLDSFQNKPGDSSSKTPQNDKFTSFKKALVTKLLIGSALFLVLTLVFTTWITASYLSQPKATQEFFKNNVASGVLSPFRVLAEASVAVIDPKKAEELGFIQRWRGEPEPPPLTSLASKPNLINKNVLAVSASSRFLEVNSDTQINGSLFVRDNLNGLSLEATPSAGTFALSSGNTQLTVTKTAKLDQDVSTTASPSFAGLNLPTLNLSGNKNQVVFQSGGPAGTLTWTPTSTQTITLPNATGTVVLDSATQTLTNKTIDASSNTLTNVPNSALANSKVTVTAGTNLTGGGDIALGGSATLALKDSPSIAGTLTVSGATTLSSTLAVSGATTLSSTLAVTGATMLTGATTMSSTLAVASGQSIGSTYSSLTPPSNGLIVQGNVGIGTSAAGSYALNVKGDANISGSLTAGTINFSGLPKGSIVFAGDSGALSENNPNLYWDNSNTRLGVGTSNPQGQLDVAGTTRLGGNVSLTSLAAGNGSALCLNGSNQVVTCTVGSGGATATGGFTGGVGFFDSSSDLTANPNFFWNSTTNSLGIGTSAPSQVFQVNDSSSNPVVITSAGFVGIGVTSPSKALDVSGNVGIGASATVTSALITGSIQNNGSLVVNGTSYLQAVNVSTLNGNTITPGSSTLTLGGNLTTTTAAITLNANGAGSNVTLPASGTLVNTDVTTLSSLTSIGSGLTGILKATAGALSAATSGTDYIAGGTGVNHQIAYFTGSGAISGSNSVWFDGTNVGIGTSNPSALLSVGNGNLFTVDSTGTVTNGTWSGNTIALNKGGTGLTTVAAGSILAANSLDSLTAITSSTGLKVLQNSAGTISWAGTTGTGSVVYSNSPSLTTPSLGAATADSINKVTITQPTSGATLTLADGKTFTVNNTMALSAGADSQTFTFPSTGGNVTVLGNTTTGTGSTLVLNTSPTFSTSIITPTVVGSTAANGTLTLQGNNTNGNGATNPNLIFKVGDNGTTQAMTILNNGNVGIGTTEPAYPFQVSGNVGIGSSLTVTSAAVLSGGLVVNGGSVVLPAGSIQNSELENSSITVSATAGTGLSVSGSPVSLGGTLTISGIDASTSVKGVASFNSTNFSVSSGAVNTIQDIATSATPTFVGLNTTSGNLGIGTSSTGSRLSVNGNGVIGWGTTSIAGPTNGLAVFGNLGVGTTSPNYKLDVVGQINASTGLCIAGDCKSSWTGVGSYTGSNGITLSSTDFQLGGQLTRATGIDINNQNFGFLGGNVGIGTTASDYNLKVQGTGFFSGFVGIGSSMNVSGNVGIGSSLTVTSAAVLSGGLVVNGGSVVLPAGSIQNSELENSSITVSATAGTGLSVSGSPVSLGGTLTISGIDASTSVKGVASFNSTNFSVSSGAVNTIQDIATSATPTFVGLNTTSGNLGIGTSSTGSRLSVNGNGVIGWGTTSIAGPTNGLAVFGNLGVGTTSPNNKLQVIGAGVFGNDYGAYNAPTNGLLVQGNIGIGTSVTSALLDVNGSALFRNSVSMTNISSGTGNGLCLNTSNQVVTCTVGTGGASATNGFTGGVAFFDVASDITANPNFFWNNSTSSLGIGTSAPSQEFQVNNSTANPVVITSGGNLGIGFTTPINPLQVKGAGVFGADYGTYAGPSNGILVQGNVGIGTSSPSYPLDVAGNARFGSNVYLNNSTAILPLVNGGADLGSDSYRFNNIYVNTINSNSTLSTTGQAIFTYTPPSSAIADSSVWINPTTATSGYSLLGVSVGGIEKARITSDGYLGLNGNNPGTSFIIDAGSPFNVTAAGNTGIGTTDPKQKLHVKGVTEIEAGGTSTTPGDSLIFAYSGYPTSYNHKIQTLHNASSAVNNRMDFLISDSGVSTYTNVLSLRGDGNVGIGTTTPSSKLVVVGNAVIGNSFTGIAAPNSGLFVEGNVGIGATTSSNKLDVWGNGRIAGNLTVDGTLNTGSLTAPNFLANNGSASTPAYSFTNLTNAGLWTNGDGLLLTTGGTNTKGITVTGAGNVGVGLTNPAYPFQVSGNVGLGASVTVTSALVTGSIQNNGSLVVNGSSYLQSIFGSNLNATGNVGIGSSLTVTSAAVLSGGLVVNGGSVVLPAGSIQNSELENSSITVSATAGTGLSVSGSPVSLGGTLTISGIDASTSVKGVASFNSTNFSVSSGAVNTIQDIATSATPTFVGLNTTSGNLGIGTSSTGSRLSVNGNGVIGWGTTSIAGPTNGLAVSGNVGIGLTNPASQLSLYSSSGGETYTQIGTLGTSSLAAVGFASSLTTSNYSIAGDGARTLINAPSTMVDFRIANSTKMTLNSSGNLGIGLTTTNSQLSISNNAHIGSLYQGTTAPTNGLFVDGNVGIGATTSSNKLDVWGNGRIAGNLTVDGTLNTGSLTAPNFLANNGSASTPSYSFTNLTNAGLWTNGDGLLLTTGSSNTSGLTVTGAGNVGIGRTNPIGLFQVVPAANQGFFVGSNGNVGIGTSNPTSLLYVNGATQTSGFPVTIVPSTSSNGITFTNSSVISFSNGTNATGEIRASDTSGILYFSTGGGAKYRMKIDQNGNVGIGNTAPNTLLNVAGNAVIGFGGTAAGPSGPANGLGVSGNVGIGTTTANSNLSVAGNAHIGSLYQGTTAPTNGLSVDGNVGIGATTSNNKLDVWGNQRVAGNLTVDGTVNGNTLTTGTGTLTLGSNSLTINTAAITLNANGAGSNVTLPASGTLVNTDVTTLSSLTSIGSGLTGILKATAGALSAATSGTDYIAGGTGVNHQIAYFTGSGAISGSNSVWFDGTNVGIGTSNPSALLSVGNGNLFTVDSTGTVTNGTWSGNTIALNKGGTGLTTVAAGSILAANSADTLTAVTSTSGLKVLQNSAGTISWAGTTGTGSVVYSDSPALTTPNIGVATATTINKVTITQPTSGATLTLADGKTLTVNNTITLAAGADGQTFTFPSTGGNVTVLGNTTTGTGSTLVLNTSPTFSTSIITPLIIGSTSANGTLTLEGNNTTGNTATNPNLLFNVGDNGSTTAMTILNNGNVGIGTTGPVGLFQVKAATSPGLIVNSSGNLGIGTSNPLALVEINGLADGTAAPLLIDPSSSGNGLRFSGSAVITFSGGSNYSGEIRAGDTGGVLRFSTGGANYRMFIDANGNVGIGNTAPNTLLNVAGNAVIGWGGTAAGPSGPSNGLAVSGNVGIGTTTADYNLSVIGTANVTGALTVGSLTNTGAFLAPNGSASAPSYSFTNLTNAGLWTNGDGLLLTTGGTNTKGLTVTGAGNVGIGTTNPVNKLDVNGAMAVGSYAGSATTSAPSNGLIVSGNVGIGSSIPNARLQVMQDSTLGAQNAQLKITGATNSNYNLFVGYDTTGNFGFIQPIQVGTIYTNLSLNGSGGNVGIGLTTANSKLSVSGSTHIGSLYQGISAPTDGLFVDGNVGIGATTSSNKLDVWGNGRIAGNLTVDGTLNTGSLTAPNFLAGNGSASAPSYSFTNLTNAGLWTNGDGLLLTTGGTDTKGLTVTGAGNVGIGVTNPAYTLDVNGSANINGNVIAGQTSSIMWSGRSRMQSPADSQITLLNNASNNFSRLNFGGTTSSFPALAVVGSDLQVIRADGSTNANLYVTGNVGIGTTGPGAQLSVAGNSTIGFGGATSIAGPANGLGISGNLGIGTTTANSNLSISGNAHIGSLYQGTVAPTNGLFVDGNVGIGATTSSNKLDVWGNGRIAGTLTIDSTGTFGNGLFGYSGVTAPTLGLAVKGNVGIGTTSPNYQLDVVGQINASTGLCIAGDCKSSWTGVGSYTGSNGITLSSTDFQLGGQLTRATGIDINNQNFGFLGGNVGIGTTAPTKQFQINASPLIGTPFTVDSAGNVGIGTTTAVYKLDIQGFDGQDLLRITSQDAATNVLSLDGQDKLIYSPTVASTATLIDLGNNKAYSTGDFFRINPTVNQSGNLLNILKGTQSLMNLNANGNLGIGTSTPNSKLTVVGNAVIGNSFTGIAAPTSGMFIEGNVGIGATTSNNKLDVWGNGRIAGTLGIDSTLTALNGLIGYSGVAAPASGLAVLGNLGIGTTSPNNKLQVIGSAAIGGDYGAYTAPTNGLLIEGNVGIGTSAPSYPLDLISTSATQLRLGYDVSDYFTTAVSSTGLVTFNAVGSGAGFNFTNSLYLGVNGSTNGSLTFYSSGATTNLSSISADSSNNLNISAPGGQLVLNGTGDINIDPSTSNLVVNLSSTGDFLFQKAGVTFGSLTHNGNLGIGTTVFTPGALLSVGGNVGIGISYTTGAMPVNGLAVQGNVGIGTTTANSTLSINGSTHIGGLFQGIAAPTNGLFVDGNVGIGATTSNNKLDVWGNERIAGTLTVDSTGSFGSTLSLSNGSATTPALNFTSSTGIGLWSPASNMVALTSGTPTLGRTINGLSVDSSGNVGIGTTNPGDLFEIKGNSSANVVKINGGPSQTGRLIEGFVNSDEKFYITNGGDFYFSVSGGAGLISNAGTGGLQFLTQGAGTNTITMMNSGNMGIGTSAPFSKFAVNGNATIGFGSSTTTPVGPASGLAVSGNIGIGTTSPARALHVTGSIRMGPLITGGGSAVAMYRDANGDLADSTSSIVYKTDVQSYQPVLDKVMQLNAVNFKWNDLTPTPGAKDFGMIAEQVNSILPDLVTYNEDGSVRGLKYEKMGVIALKAIQEQQTEINSLIGQINSFHLSIDPTTGGLNLPDATIDHLTITSDAKINGSLETQDATINSKALVYLADNLSEFSSLIEPSLHYVDIAASLKSLDDKQQVLSAQVDSQSNQLADLTNKIASLSAQLAASTQPATPSASQPVATPNPTVAPDATSSAQIASSSATPAATSSATTTDTSISLLNLTPPDVLLATTSAQLVNLTVTSDATVSGQLTAYQAAISDTFKSLGQTFLGTTTIAGDLTVDGTMSINGNSLSTLGTLHLQNGLLADNVDFFNGLVTIDKNGSLIAQKVSTPELVTNKLTISNVPVASSSASLQPTIGSGTLLTGQIEIPIFTNQADQNSKIFVTPKSSTSGQSLYVKEIVPGAGFVVGIDSALSHDVNFDWWIVGTQ